MVFFSLTKAEAQTIKETSQKKKLEEYRQRFWDNIPAPTGWINDYEKDFNQQQITTLNKLITQFKNETSIQIAIVTIDTTMTDKEKFNNLVLRIAKKWAVGEKGKDNGIVIGFSRLHRLIRISNGYGIEKLISDKETKGIIDQYIIPNFKKDDYYTGTFKGLTELMKLLKTKIKD